MRIRVATLNVWALPTLFAEQVSARIRAIGERLPSLDLDAISFQEAWTPDARAALSAMGRRAGLIHSWSNGTSYGDGGLLVLSRFPVRRARFERFALRGPPEEIGQGDFYGGKGFAQIELETTGGPVTLLNTHLQARYSKRVHHEYSSLRVGQIVQLAIEARKLRNPILVTGDFNFREGDAGYRVLTGLTGLRDTAADLNNRQPTVYRGNAYRRGKRDKRIDYVFARDGDAHRVEPLWVNRIFDDTIEIDGRPAAYSNHAGVAAEFEIIRGPTRASRGADPDAVEIASRLLSEGRADARRRQRDARGWASAGVSCALVSAAGLRGLGTTRRQLLRAALRGAALLTLTPSVGVTILSEVFVPDELRAFEELARQLAQVDSGLTEHSFA